MSESKSNGESKYNDDRNFSGPPKTNRILHDIRNMRILNNEQIETIRRMTANEKMEVIVAYNSIMHSINDVINNM
uniref:Uncharacterized protein n=1 Tax=viral metagenome TaxID=1070528 RepID=A0A6C0K2D7_9ZZZZ